MEVLEVGCGGPRGLVQATYAGGVAVGGDERIEVRVLTDVHAERWQTDVLRARVAWRLLGAEALVDGNP
jgi:hypothetical protein